MIKRMACLLLILLLCGCGRDAAQLTVVTGIGVDGHPGGYQVGAEVIRLSEGDGEGNQSVYLRGTGVTITDSINNMVSMTGRTLYCNHAQVLVVSRETAQNGMKPILEELLRGTQYPISLRLAVCKDTAAQTMRAKPVISDLHSVELEDMIRAGAKQCITADVDAGAFYQQVAAQGVEGVLPFLTLEERDGETVCSLDGTALFQKDRMLAVLDARDSCSLMWMQGKSGGTLVTEHAVFEVMGLDRKLEADRSGAKLTLELVLKASDSESNREALMAEAEMALAQRCGSLLERLRWLECDAVGFGSRIAQTHPKQWAAMGDDWPSLFADYPILVEVRVKNLIWGRIWSDDGQGG
ncbi:MAG: hypothetical protein IKU58_00360 [Clostridia bacterium]|nr:hypothetical protein [Clostridia bacterium]